MKGKTKWDGSFTTGGLVVMNLMCLTPEGLGSDEEPDEDDFWRSQEKE
jgi:hypothetical protein